MFTYLLKSDEEMAAARERRWRSMVVVEH